MCENLENATEKVRLVDCMSQLNVAKLNESSTPYISAEKRLFELNSQLSN